MILILKYFESFIFIIISYEAFYRVDQIKLLINAFNEIILFRFFKIFCVERVVSQLKNS